MKFISVELLLTQKIKKKFTTGKIRYFDEDIENHGIYL